MPFFGGGGMAPSQDVTTGMQPNQAAADWAASNNYPQGDQSNSLLTAAGQAALTPLDLADTLASNHLISWATGLNRGDLTNAVLNSGPSQMIGSPVYNALGLGNIGDFYQRNKEGVETMSGIGGLVASELLARRITAPGSIAMNLISKVPYARRIASLDKEYQNALATVGSVGEATASKGAFGAAQFAGTATVNALRYADTASGFGFETLPITTSHNAAVGVAKGLGFLQAVRNAAVTEGVAYSALNSNGFLYSDDAAQNMAWQALGLVGAGAGEWLHGAWQLRKGANSDIVKRAYANATDPQGYEQNRLLWNNNRGQNPLPDSQAFAAGKYTDDATNLFVNAKTLTDGPLTGTDDVRTLLSNRTNLATGWLRLGKETLQKAFTKGIDGLRNTSFTTDTPGYGNHAMAAAYRDPTAFYGVETAGAVSPDTTSSLLHEQFMNGLQQNIARNNEMLASQDIPNSQRRQLEDNVRRLNWMRTWTPSTLINMEHMPLSEASVFEGFSEPRMSFVPNEASSIAPAAPGGIHVATPIETGTEPSTVGTDFLWHLPGSNTLDNANHYDIMRLYRAKNAAIDMMVKMPEQQWALPKNPDWFQLDMANELMDRTGGRAKILWPAGLDAQSSQVESLVQKAEAIKPLVLDQKLAIASGQNPDSILSQTAFRYNLPQLTAYERGLTGETMHPVESLLRGIQNFGPDQVRNMSLADVKQSVAEIKRMGDLSPVTKDDIRTLRGSSDRFMLDDNGNPIKPILVYRRPMRSVEWSQHDLADRLAMNKLNTLATLTGKDAAPLTQALTNAIVKSPDAETAMATHTLMDTQIQGSILGTAPQTFIGTVSRIPKTAEWIARDQPTIQAARRLYDSVTRIADAYMRTTITNAFGDSLNLLKNPRNTQSKMLLDQFFTHRPGWDLEKTTVPLPIPAASAQESFTGFKLSDTARNRERWFNAYQSEMPKGQVLVNPQGNPIALDDIGLDLARRYHQVHGMYREEQNTLLRARGLPEIDYQNWHVPPPNMRGKFVKFTIGPDGKTVPNMSIIADSPEKLARMEAEDLNPKLAKLGLGYTTHTPEQIREFGSLWDRAQMDMMMPSLTPVQPGKTARGILSGPVTNTSAFDEAMKTLRDGFTSHARDTVETLFKEQLDSAKARGNLSGAMAAGIPQRIFGDLRYRSIHDYYRQALLGTSGLNSPGSITAKFYNPVEGFINEALKSATPPAHVVWDALNGWLNRANPWSKTDAAKADFETLAGRLSDYMPFESAEQMAHAQTNSAVPLTAKDLARNLNRFAAAMSMRVMEFGAPFRNMADVINAMPAVIRNYTMQPGESVEQFAARIGHNASIFSTPNGAHYGVVDMAKLAAGALKDAWSPQEANRLAYRTKMGYAKMEIQEFHNQFGSISSKGTWERAIMGDTSIQNAKFGTPDWFKMKGLDGMLSVLGDGSEDLSRHWAHTAGVRLSKDLGIVKMEDQENFAHDIANKMIANYSPTNRAEMFQGAVGSSIGLFQSFTQNYWQRMFRYIETKDYRSLATQYAMQGAFYGYNTIPGFKEFNELMSKFAPASENAEPGDPESNLTHRFGAAGHLLRNGVISNLPALFNNNWTAPDVFSREGTDIRVPAIPYLNSASDILSQSPALSDASRIMGGLTQLAGLIGQGIDDWTKGRSDLSRTQIAEVVANADPNRMSAALIRFFFDHGNVVDKNGQIVTQTKNALESAYNIVGIRSQRQSDEINAYYANKAAMEHKAAADDVLRVATRAAIRDGNTDALPAIFQKYIENGGDPRFYSRWLQSNVKAATTGRSQRELQEVMKSPVKMGMVARLLDADVSIDSDEKTPSGGIYDNQNIESPLEQPTGGLRQYPLQSTAQVSHYPGNGPE